LLLAVVAVLGDGAGDLAGGDPILRKSPPMPRLELLRDEKELLGLYLSGHPLSDFHGLDEAIGHFDELDGDRLRQLAAGLDRFWIFSTGECRNGQQAERE
jgi:DNA polymerase III alpha subunit